MTTTAPEIGRLGRVARVFGLAGLAYWGIYALVAPVTNIDSQMYNLSRIELAARGGLFANGLFTSVYHVMWPWTFDAVHLPFLQLGWGYALPSYCCLVGTCYIVFAMMRDRWGADAAWVAVVALLGLTCLVYQGTSTKNDIPVLFAGAVWIYARWRWRREEKQVHLFWMVLALGFMAGSKTSGLLNGTLLGLWTLAEVARNRRLLGKTLLGLAASVLLFGSVETYVETARIFGHPLGPPAVLAPLQNHDGLRGTAANLTRMVAGSVYLGPTRFHSASAAARRWMETVKVLLARTGLKNAGSGNPRQDDQLFFHQSGFEEFSGFGPLGTLAMAAMLAAAVFWRPGAVWWRLAAGAAGGMVLGSLTVAYNDWGNRYLISWYALATVAVVCVLWESDAPWRRWCRPVFAALAIASALAAPLLAFNRGPGAIIAALRDRERFETSAYPLAGDTRARLRELRKETPASRVYYVVCTDSLILPILEDRQLQAILVTPPVFHELVGAGRVAAGDLVIEDFPSGLPMLQPVDEISSPDIYVPGQRRVRTIFRVRAAAPPPGVP